MTPARNDLTRSPWPGRLAAWTFWAAVPLVLFGGTVTTMRAGMAEDGWLRPDGHVLWLYPWAMRIRDAGVFVEHHHRELGSLVGFLAIGTVVATLVGDPRGRAKLAAVLALVAVSVQGAIGGFRVLENRPDLAFLHGGLGQAVFALLAAVALYLSPRWVRFESVAPGSGSRTTSVAGLATLARATTAAAFTQAVIGAWLRHGHATGALLVHLAGAFVTVALLLTLAQRLVEAATSLDSKSPESPESTESIRSTESMEATEATEATEAARVLTRCRRNLLFLVSTQLLLGVVATWAIYSVSGGMQSTRIAPAELVFATAHVAVGALLLATCTNTALWAARLTALFAPEGSAADALSTSPTTAGGAA